MNKTNINNANYDYSLTVYSMFALFEYGVVLTNMGFHMLAVWDFYDKSVIISSRGIFFS